MSTERLTRMKRRYKQRERHWAMVESQIRLREYIKLLDDIVPNIMHDIERADVGRGNGVDAVGR